MAAVGGWSLPSVNSCWRPHPALPVRCTQVQAAGFSGSTNHAAHAACRQPGGLLTTAWIFRNAQLQGSCS